MANSYSLIKTIDRPTFALAWMSNNLQLNEVITHPTLVATMNDWNLNVTVNQPTLVATALGGEILTVNQVIVQPTLVASIISGRLLSLNKTAPRPTLTANATTETFYSLVKTINNVSIVARLSLDNTYNLSSLIRRPSLVTYWTTPSVPIINNDTVGTPVATYVINTMNSAHSEYTNYGFNSYFRLANNYYGINSTGVWKLSGNLDDTTVINSEVATPVSSFDKQGMKACSDAIIFGRLQGNMEVVAIQDEQEEREGFVVLDDNREGLHRIRVKIPKGLKGSTWQFKIKNVDGSNFAINNFEVFLRELQRIR